MPDRRTGCQVSAYPTPAFRCGKRFRKMVHPCERKAGQSCMHHLHCKSEEPAGKRHSFLSRERQGRRERMRNTYWFAVDYNGTGHLFTCPPKGTRGCGPARKPLHPQRTVRRDVSANHLAGRAGGGDPGGASLRGNPATASCQALLHLLRRHTGRNQSKDMRIHNNSP